MIHFYKPNSRVTGTACSFYLNANDGSFFSTLIKQDGWDSKRKIGSFSKNKDNPSKKVNIKLSPTEIAGFIDALESNREFTGYHGSNQIVRFKFCPYLKDEKQIGYSFSATKESKEDSTDKVSFLIGFYFQEGRLLKEHLIFLLREKFELDSQKFKNKSTSGQFSKSRREPVAKKSESITDFFGDSDGSLSNNEEDEW